MNDLLWNDLTQRLRALDRTNAVLTGRAALGAGRIAQIAQNWAESLESLTDFGTESAERVRDHLVPDCERESSTFWSTPLGRALARQGLAPVNATGQVPAVVVGAIFGFTRSRAHELQQRGRMTTPGLVAQALQDREVARG